MFETHYMAFANTSNVRSHLRVNRNKVSDLEGFPRNIVMTTEPAQFKSFTQIHSFTNKNGRQRNHEPWQNLQKSAHEALNTSKKLSQSVKGDSRKSVDVQKEIINYRFRYIDQRRYDQTEKPFYPAFDSDANRDKLDRVGWRSNCKTLKYKTAHP